MSKRLRLVILGLLLVVPAALWADGGPVLIFAFTQ